MEVVNAYKYLGLYFTTKLRFTCACNDLAVKGKTAALGILSVLNKFEVQSINIFQKLFDSKVQPVLLYAAEIWGLDDDYCNQIEKNSIICIEKIPWCWSQNTKCYDIMETLRGIPCISITLSRRCDFVIPCSKGGFLRVLRFAPPSLRYPPQWGTAD